MDDIEQQLRQTEHMLKHELQENAILAAKVRRLETALRAALKLNSFLEKEYNRG